VIIYIDESGDPGFKIDKGSSEYFVIAMVIFDDNLVAEKTALSIRKLKCEQKRSESFEYKFNKCSKGDRKSFLESIKDFDFRVRAIVLKKEAIYSGELRSSKDKFYSYALKTLLQNNNKTIKNAKIRLDGLGGKTFKNNLTSYLRKNLNSAEQKVLENLKFRDSKKDVLIQLADMVVGAIKRKYSKKEDSKIYYKIIKERIEDIWEFK
jgi:hypothetical protein